MTIWEMNESGTEVIRAFEMPKAITHFLPLMWEEEENIKGNTNLMKDDFMVWKHKAL